MFEVFDIGGVCEVFEGVVGVLVGDFFIHGAGFFAEFGVDEGEDDDDIIISFSLVDLEVEWISSACFSGVIELLEEFVLVEEDRSLFDRVTLVSLSSLLSF